MIQILITIELNARNDLAVDVTKYRRGAVHPEESKMSDALRDALQTRVQEIIEKSPNGGVQASGPSGQQICESMAKQYHRENPL